MKYFRDKRSGRQAGKQAGRQTSLSEDSSLNPECLSVGGEGEEGGMDEEQTTGGWGE